MQDRAIQAICLGPTGNFQGTYKFLDLESGQVVKRKRFDEFPMPDSVISKLERWGRRDQQNGRLTFADRNNVAFDWDEEYEFKPLIDDNAVEPEIAAFPDIPAELPGVDLGSNVPAMTEPLVPEPPAADEAAAARQAALANANFGPREQAVLDAAHIAGVMPQQQPIHNINFNLVPHGEGELAPQNVDNEDDNDDAPDLQEANDSDPDKDDDDYDYDDYDDYGSDSDDESYKSGDEDEYESDDHLDEDFVDEEEAQRDETVTTRSGLFIKRNQQYR
jgi:hypothetical protein